MRSVVDNLRPMLGDQFHSPTSSASVSPIMANMSQQQQPNSLDLSLRNTTATAATTNDLIICGQSLLSLDNNNRSINNHENEHQQRAIRSYYQPLLSSSPLSTPSTSPSNPYESLNQKRESVITFSHTNLSQNDQSQLLLQPQQQRLTSITKLYSNAILHHQNNGNDDDVDSNEDQQNIVDDDDDNNNRTKSSSKFNGLLLSKLASIGMRGINISNNNNNKLNDEQQQEQIILVNNIPLTIDQIICICQVLQKCDLQKLEKFIYDLPNDSLCNKNELIIRARAIAAYHSGNFKQVYDLLEANSFPVKYHQELQSLWNNAHYKEHEMKRGHPPGAVEKYRIRKKYQFPRTIWDGEEYVYCFKEKNRRILKEFYLKCNLPTQEDKLKLSNETQLTVVQISNWFKNRRQRDRQPHLNHHHHHDNHHHHHHHQHHHQQQQHQHHNIHEDQELPLQHHHQQQCHDDGDDDNDDDSEHEKNGSNHQHQHHHHQQQQQQQNQHLVHDNNNEKLVDDTLSNEIPKYFLR
nr:protein sine oculis-like [Dermatophagoides farinae]